MKVKLKYKWFAPSAVANSGKLNQSSGTLYQPGVVVDIPEAYRKLLPSTAVILDDKAPDPVVRDKPITGVLRDFDSIRAADEAAGDVREAADKAAGDVREAADKALRERAEAMKAAMEAEEKPKKKYGKE